MDNTVKERYINLFTDFGFKKLFGEEPNKDLLIDFLNSCLLSDNQQITKLEYKKNDHLGQSDIDRNVVFDLYCENQNGEKFIVELQKAKQTHFKDRILFYSTFPIQEQAPKGIWNYELKSVYAIAILDFSFDDQDKDKVIVKRKRKVNVVEESEIEYITTPTEKKKDGTVVNRVKLMDIEKNEVFYDKLLFVFLQIPNFTKPINEIDTNFERWLYVFKNLHKLESLPKELQTHIFEKVFKIAEYTKLKRDEQAKYRDSLKYYNDLKNSLDTAKSEGRQEAEELLLPIIEEERRLKEEERKQKEEAQQKLLLQKEEAQQKLLLQKEEAQQKLLLQKEEAQQKLLHAARMLLNKGMKHEEIAQITGLSKDQIEKY